MIYRTTGFRPQRILFLFLVVLFCCLNVAAKADKIQALDKELLELNKISDELRSKVLSLLTLVKELEKSGPVTGSQIAKIIYPEEPVKEANIAGSKSIFTAKYNDELLILEKSDIWYRVRLEDGREGWIKEESVQVIVQDRSSIQQGQPGSNMGDNELLMLLSILNRDIENQYISAKMMISSLENRYAGLTSDQKSISNNTLQSISQTKEKIEKYYSYAKKFIQPYSELLVGVNVKSNKKRTVSQNRFMGKVSMELGRTIQNTTNDMSGFAGNLDFSGLYKVNGNTTITGGVRYQEEVIRTPFASMRVDAGIKNNFNNQMNLVANLGYDNYNDKFDNANDFNVIRAGANLSVPFGKKSQLSGHLSHSIRKYKIEGGSNFASTRYMLNAFLRNNSKLETNIYFRGNLQSSAVNYLSFNQLNPGIVLKKRRVPGKSFSTLIDLNIYKYSGEAERSNFSRGRLDFKWMRRKTGKNKTSYLGFIGKQFPNNERLNYIRANTAFTSTKGNLGLGRSKTSTFRATYTYYMLQDTTSLVDYMDMRFDRIRSGRKGFINFNMFGRLLNSIGRDMDVYHTLDMYLTVGPIFGNRKSKNTFNLRIGPVIGAHILVGSEVEFWENNGTSFRGGIAMRGNINIQKASIRFMGTYERQFLITNEYDLNDDTGELTVGEVIVRKPNSFQFDFDFRLPISQRWDVHFNVNYYNIITDATEEASILDNPNDQNMRLRMVGGVAYRFIL